MPDNHVVIDARYCGPPGMGNGGYVAGRLAAYIDGPVEVMLRQPTPLDTELTVVENGGEGLLLKHGDTVIAEARPHLFDLDVPASPTVAEAEAAWGNHPGLDSHPVPGCFVCGPKRSDGLRVCAGRIPGRDYVATAWTPAADLADESGRVRPEFIWAVLDCPGGFSLGGDVFIPVLLGKFALQILADVIAEQPYVITAWLKASEGRKYFTGTAIHSAAGELCACASGTWIALKDPSMLGT